ncbi:MAG: hypothetical protein VCB42_07175 [Myxococcota bacterium]
MARGVAGNRGLCREDTCSEQHAAETLGPVVGEGPCQRQYQAERTRNTPRGELFAFRHCGKGRQVSAETQPPGAHGELFQYPRDPLIIRGRPRAPTRTFDRLARQVRLSQRQRPPRPGKLDPGSQRRVTESFRSALEFLGTGVCQDAIDARIGIRKGLFVAGSRFHLCQLFQPAQLGHAARGQIGQQAIGESFLIRREPGETQRE